MIVQRPMRLPDDADVAALLDAGWCPSRLGVGWFVDASASGETLWWVRALERARRDRHRGLA